MNNFYRLVTGVAVCLLFLASTTVYAQRTVRGTVTDATDGSTLPGVTIRVKGTGSGTTTDLDGNYSIQVNAGNVLVFSSVGYVEQEVDPGARSVIDISLAQDIAQLGEVVVVGYGVQEARDVTGSMASLDAKDFNAGVINSPDQLIQGKLAGVQITPSSGQPGGGVNVPIRGASSIRANNNPLYVIDGFPVDGRSIGDAGVDEAGLGGGAASNPLAFLNPDDIQSIDVLKDASATAIYGSRGANGVIMITTKKGESGKGILTYNSFVGLDQLPNKIDLLTADEYVPAAVAAGATASAVDFGGSTDWQDEVFRNAISHGHSIGFGGGSENSTYRMSLSYLDQDGIVETSNFTRLTGRINGSHKFLNDRINLDFQLTASQNSINNVPISNNAGFQGSLIGAALQANPTIPVRDADGNFYQGSQSIGSAVISNDFRNPMAMIEYITDEEKVTRILGNIGATVKLTDNFKYRINAGVDNGESVRRVFYDSRLFFPGTSLENANGRATLYNRYLSSSLLENYVTYDLNLGNADVEILAGHSFQQFANRGHRFSVTNLPTGDVFLGFNNVDGGTSPGGGDNPFASDGEISQLQSFYGRVNTSIQDKYLITATLRADGSSRFGPNNRYGYFPSIALGWRMSEEPFIPDFFTDLKLRGGWGVVGNQEILNGLSINRFQIDNTSGSLTLLAFGNPDIKWEQTSQLNVGFDFAVMEGRLSGTFDFFNKNTTDLLAQFFTAQPAFTQFFWDNLDATIVNTGLEFSASYVAVDNENLRWDIGGNLTYLLVNEVRGLGSTFFNTGEINGQGLSGAYAQRITEGQPLNVWYMREYTGLEGGAQQFANDGQLSFVGSPHPDLIYGFNTGISAGAFDLNVTFNGLAGNQVYNNTANALFLKGALANGRNVTQEVADVDENRLEAPIPSTRYLEDGSFLRLNNFTAGYNIDMSNVDAISSLRFYVSGQNLFVLTQYTGYDPEVNVNKALNDIPSTAIDYTGFPRSRTFQAGINVRF
ncbi:MAG TPA: SusC/RagA family TonB-linked outer membrane protein [Cytophagales bacterium]|nr:SusC/RagA family TonB-linked outer membrane protein [Cytophagales bacterium]